MNTIHPKATFKITKQRTIVSKSTNRIKWNHKNTSLIFEKAIKRKKEQMVQIENKYDRLKPKLVSKSH